MCYIFITLIEDFCLHQMDRPRRLITKPSRYQTTSSEEEAVIHQKRDQIQQQSRIRRLTRILAKNFRRFIDKYR